MAWPAAGYFSSGILNSQAKAAQDTWLALTRKLTGAQGTIGTLTIAAGVIVPTGERAKVDTEAAASTDDLDSIDLTNLEDGGIITISIVSNSRTVRLRHAQGSTGQIFLDDSTNFTLTNTTQSIVLRRDGNAVYEENRNLGSLMHSTETNVGDIEIATQAETTTGTDDVRAITPLKLVTHIANQLLALAKTVSGLWTFTDTKNTEQTLTDGATVNWDVHSGNVAKVTIAGNRTMGAPTNLQTGGFYFLRIIQDATGSRTISSWNAAFSFGTAGAPTLSTTAAKQDTLSFFYNGSKLLCTGVAKGF